MITKPSQRPVKKEMPLPMTVESPRLCYNQQQQRHLSLMTSAAGQIFAGASGATEKENRKNKMKQNRKINKRTFQVCLKYLYSHEGTKHYPSQIPIYKMRDFDSRLCCCGRKVSNHELGRRKGRENNDESDDPREDELCTLTLSSFPPTSSI